MVVNGIVNGRKLKSRVTAIIQARMQSKRLPGKAMLDLAGKPLLAHVIERTASIEGVDTVVLATCEGAENLPIIELARSMNVGVFVGSMENVLERYCFAAREFGGEYIVRVTGDNPFTCPDYAAMALDISLEASCDLCALGNLPLGAAVEIIKREALEEAYKLSDKPFHREHVTPFIKEHPELFHIERPAADLKNPFPNLRLTVDTMEDYTLSKIIYENLYHGEIFSLAEVIAFLQGKPELMSINVAVKQRPMTHAEKKGT
jgi:spore coat polysaccharide biosynthesis protein SpsF